MQSQNWSAAKARWNWAATSVVKVVAKPLRNGSWKTPGEIKNRRRCELTRMTGYRILRGRNSEPITPVGRLPAFQRRFRPEPAAWRKRCRVLPETRSPSLEQDRAHNAA